jgi:ribonuclease D
MITTSAELSGLVDRLPTNGSPFAGIDLEADNLHRYAEQLCLIQISTGEEVILVDPLEVDELEPLRSYLVANSIWMHGADFDMTLLRREFGMLPKMIYDTQIASRLLGILRFSYANLVEQFFGVKLCKASQKENWGQRPLPEKMCEYASNDVRYLLPLADKLEEDLHGRGRFDWFVESCRAAMERVLNRDVEREDPWRLRGAGKLDCHALCLLRALWNWRDAEAREWDRPHFMVVRNQQLIVWAELLARGEKLETPRNVRGGRARRLKEAIEKARQIPRSEWPERRKGTGRRWNSSQEKRYEDLARKRDQAADSLELESAVIAPRAALEQIALEADPSEHLLRWQRDVLEL